MIDTGSWDSSPLKDLSSCCSQARFFSSFLQKIVRTFNIVDLCPLGNPETVPCLLTVFLLVHFRYGALAAHCSQLVIETQTSRKLPELKVQRISWLALKHLRHTLDNSVIGCKRKTVIDYIFQCLLVGEGIWVRVERPLFRQAV